MELLPVSQMLSRLIVALVLGAVMGFEREVIHKDAGIKTSMLVAGGASLFTIVGISLPYLFASSVEGANAFEGATGSLNVIANIVVGIGFIGGGIIMKEGRHVQGLTTAALIWSTAAIGILAGLGLWKIAASPRCSCRSPSTCCGSPGSATTRSGTIWRTRRTRRGADAATAPSGRRFFMYLP